MARTDRAVVLAAGLCAAASALLFVAGTANAAPSDRDLSVGLTTSGSFVPGGDLALVVEVTNSSAGRATGDVVAVPVPAGLTYASSATASGTYSAATGRWHLAPVPAQTSVFLVVHVTPSDTPPSRASVELVAAGQPDPDSTPGNHVATEDDQAAVRLIRRPADLSLAARVTPASVPSGSPATIRFTLADRSGVAAGPTVVSLTIPAQLTVTGVDPGSGSYDAESHQWSVPGVAAHGSAVLVLHVTTSGLGSPSVVAEVTSAWSPDPDSFPGDENPDEDDYVQATVAVTGDGSNADSLVAVACPSSAFCVAVGSSTDPGTGLSSPLVRVRTSSGWSTANVPQPSDAFGLDGVACAAVDSCVAVGDSPSGSYSVVWDGTTWTLVAFAALPGNGSLGAVSCDNATSCTAVGQWADQFGDYQAVSEHFDGSAWTVATIPQPAADGVAYLHAVSCPTATFCMAVGQYHPYGDNLLRAWSAIWNGSTWQVVTTATTPHFAANLQSVSCPTAVRCLAVGNVDAGGSLAEIWELGSGWATTTPGAALDAQTAFLFGASCPSDSLCVTVGLTDDTGSGEHLAAARLAGLTWSVDAPPAAPGGSQRFTAVSCAATTFCVGVGHGTAEPTGVSTRLAETFDGSGWSVDPSA